MRLDYLMPEMMDEDQKRYYKNLHSGQRGKLVPVSNEAGALGGPFNAWAYSPIIGDRIQSLGEELRFHNSLPENLSQVVILMVGREWRAQFEWWAHAQLAKMAGIADEVIEDIKNGKRPDSATHEELVVYDFGRELLDRKRVSEENYQKVKDLIGEKGVVNLVGLMGFFTLVSMTLNVFQAPLPEGAIYPFEED